MTTRTSAPIISAVVGARLLPAMVAAPPAHAPVPAPPAPPKFASTDAARLSDDKVGLNWTVNVTSTADNPGECTFTARNHVRPGPTKNFGVGPRGTASFAVAAPPPLSTYHVVASSTGTFAGKTVEFGHVEKDVSA